MLVSEVVFNYVNDAIRISKDKKHGYSQVNRWSPDFDCSSLIIYVVERAGIKVKNAGARATSDMVDAFLKCGFKDVVDSITLETGEGLRTGDIVIVPYRHAEIYIGDGLLLAARSDEVGGRLGKITGDQTGDEISMKKYYNYNWKSVLRLY